MKFRAARHTLDEEDYKQGAKAVERHECTGQTDNWSHSHNEACPPTDVCIPFNLRILETIKGIL